MQPGASTVQFKPGIENIDRVNESLSRWRSGGCLPLSMNVIEFWGVGDPFFGGNQDDRPLGVNGLILSRPYKDEDIAEFASIELAHEAAKQIPNRRAGSLLGVLTKWR